MRRWRSGSRWWRCGLRLRPAPRRRTSCSSSPTTWRWNLVQYMPHVQALQPAGTTFADYFVTDSLCCPSRSSIFTGDFPHNTGVFTNSRADGGFAAFHARGDESSDVRHRARRRAGYRTGDDGQVPQRLHARRRRGRPALTSRPAGTSGTWPATATGVQLRPQPGRAARRTTGTSPQDYLTDVVGRPCRVVHQRRPPTPVSRSSWRWRRSPRTRPYTPAPRDAQDFPGLGAPRGPAFDVPEPDAPRWLSGHAPLSPQQIDQIDTLVPQARAVGRRRSTT